MVDTTAIEIFFAGLLPVVVSTYVIPQISNKYSLNNKLVPKEIDGISIPPQIKNKYQNVDLTKITTLEIKKIVLEFISVLEKNFPKEVLANFYNRINEADIRKDLSIILHGSLGGEYFPVTNRVNCSILNSLYHELFHLASSISNDEHLMSGFYQDPPGIGKGLTEGYTELLTHRYFDAKHHIHHSYKISRNISFYLENIVGMETMQNLYLTADLVGLISSLEQYNTTDEIVKFLNNVDYLQKYCNDQVLFRNEQIGICLKEVYSFLLKTYVTKLRIEYENGIIADDELIGKISEYISLLKNKVVIWGHSYECFSENTIDEIIADVLSDLETNKIIKLVA